jgi:glycerol-3-phosphate acyltransferase PlsY
MLIFASNIRYAILLNRHSYPGSDMPNLSYLLFPILGYLSGSLPFSIWVTRYAKNVDVRDAGSGHATTTNTIRQAGFGWGALVLVLDITKGFVPTYLAIKYAGNPWVVALTAALAVAGHCWPIFAQFRGGMGLATFGGALLAANWFAFVVGMGLLLALTLILHHGARASVLAGILIAPLFWLLGLRGIELWIAVAGGLVIAFRFLIDWNRKYRELWLDREKQ